MRTPISEGHGRDASRSSQKLSSSERPVDRSDALEGSGGDTDDGTASSGHDDSNPDGSGAGSGLLEAGASPEGSRSTTDGARAGVPVHACAKTILHENGEQWS